MITKIYIKNFRSIKEMNITCENITTFIGQNDAGKSNIVKALNLFFNGETDHGEKFDFNKDFCKFHQTSQKKAKEIIMHITFKIPSSYGIKTKRKVIWRKSWRRQGEIQNRNPFLYAPDRTEISPRSKIPSWLRRIKFYYVPAIKDKTFFSYLMGKLYLTLEKTSQKRVKSQESFLGSIDHFKSAIQSETEILLNELGKIFEMDSEINMPEDFSKIFEELEFNLDQIPLNRRGDGIKIRHIPEILYFIGSRENSSSGKGTAIQSNIWAFEEPENCVELASSFKLAEKFIKCANEGYQIFITTHSPVFYRIDKEKQENIQCFNYCIQKEFGKNIIQSKNSPANSEDQLAELDNEIGFMPFIEPYIKEEKQRLKNEYKKLKPTIYLEGKTDVAIFNHTLNLFFPSYKDKIEINDFKSGSAGANYVSDKLISWQKDQKHVKKVDRLNAYGFFDYDDEGRKAHAEIEAVCKEDNLCIKFDFYNSRKINNTINKMQKNICDVIKISESDSPASFSIDIFLESLYHKEIYEFVHNIPLDENQNIFSELPLFSNFSQDEFFYIKNSKWEKNKKNEAVDYVNNVIKKDKNKGKILLENFEPLLKDALKFLFPRDSL